jgi:hypothetical protein
MTAKIPEACSIWLSRWSRGAHRLTAYMSPAPIALHATTIEPSSSRFELDLDRERVEWIELPDGVEALSVNGGGIDGGDGAHFVNYGDDVHACVRERGPAHPRPRRLRRDPAGRQPLLGSRGARPAGWLEADAPGIR